MLLLGLQKIILWYSNLLDKHQVCMQGLRALSIIHCLQLFAGSV